jgi:hypothetical protein
MNKNVFPQNACNYGSLLRSLSLATKAGDVKRMNIVACKLSNAKSV